MIRVEGWDFAGASYKRTAKEHVWTVAFRGAIEDTVDRGHIKGQPSDIRSVSVHECPAADFTLSADYNRRIANLKVVFRCRLDEDPQVVELSNNAWAVMQSSGCLGCEVQPVLSWEVES